jgi:transposase-like protein
VDATGHTWEDKYTVDTPATCTEDGSKSIHCANCDAKKDSETISATGHDWDTGTVTKAATCKETGVKTFTCNNENCSVKTKTEPIEIDPSAHSISKVEAKDATCTEEGNSEYYVCEYCGKLFSDKDATTVTTLVNVTIAAKGHNISLVAAEEATCAAAGNIEHYTCDQCEKNFQDEAGTVELTDSAVVIEALPHTWDDGVVTKEATATTKGEKVYTCADCGETKTLETPATGTSNGAAGGTNNGNGNGKTQPAAPKTGDASNIALWVVMMSVCAAGVVVISAKKKTGK